MRERTCCFTGHRELPVSCRTELAARLEETIVHLYQNSIQIYEAGGALGWDTLAARTVLKLKESYSDIRLILILPCLTQTRGWPAEDVKEYERIKGQADSVIYTGREYTKGCMFKRNRRLVEDSCVCVCYLTRKKGGTAYTVSYALKQGLKTVNLALFQGMGYNEQ